MRWYPFKTALVSHKSIHTYLEADSEAADTSNVTSDITPHLPAGYHMSKFHNKLTHNNIKCNFVWYYVSMV